MQNRQAPAEASRRSTPQKSRSAADSARTSFLLSPEAVVATEWLIDRVGSPKEAFRTIEESLINSLVNLDHDFFMEQLDRWFAPPSAKGAKEVRPQSVGGYVPNIPLPDTSTRKSFVIRAKTLQGLNKAARRKKIKRDVLVNYLLINSKNEMEAQNNIHREKQVQAEKLFRGIRDFCGNAGDNIKQRVGEDDPIYQAVLELLAVMDRLVDRMDEILETGEPITEPFDTSV